MKNNTKQVVILDNFSSPYIHQAILILKDYNPALEDKVIAEAEKIVSDYLKQPMIYSPKKESGKFIPFLISLLIVSAVAASIFLFF